MRNGEPLDYRGEEPPGRYTWRTVVGIILLIAGFPFAGCYGYVFVGMSVLGLLDPDPQPREHWNDGPWPFFLLAVGGVAAVTAGAGAGDTIPGSAPNGGGGVDKSFVGVESSLVMSFSLSSRLQPRISKPPITSKWTATIV